MVFHLHFYSFQHYLLFISHYPFKITYIITCVKKLSVTLAHSVLCLELSSLLVCLLNSYLNIYTMLTCYLNCEIFITSLPTSRVLCPSLPCNLYTLSLEILILHGSYLLTSL